MEFRKSPMDHPTRFAERHGARSLQTVCPTNTEVIFRPTPNRDTMPRPQFPVVEYIEERNALIRRRNIGACLASGRRDFAAAVAK